MVKVSLGNVNKMLDIYSFISQLTLLVVTIRQRRFSFSTKEYGDQNKRPTFLKSYSGYRDKMSDVHKRL